MASQNETLTTTIRLKAEEVHSEIKRLEKEKETTEKKILNLQGKKSKEAKKQREELTKDLQRISKELQAQKKYAAGLDSVIEGLSTKTYNDLRNEVRQLNKLMRDGTINKNTEEWKEMAEHIKKCKKEMKEYELAVEETPKKISSYCRKISFCIKSLCIQKVALSII